MQVIGSSVADRERRAGERLRPGLDVSVLALSSHAGRPEVHLSVRGGTAPVRLYLYVDGDLQDSQSSGSDRFRVDLVGLDVGRHTLTARAIDATGRWGGASIVVAVPEPAEVEA
jgi:hypothetical protein